jgi:hypothetical protein
MQKVHRMLFFFWPQIISVFSCLLSCYMVPSLLYRQIDIDILNTRYTFLWLTILDRSQGDYWHKPCDSSVDCGLNDRNTVPSWDRGTGSCLLGVKRSEPFVAVLITREALFPCPDSHHGVMPFAQWQHFHYVLINIPQGLEEPSQVVMFVYRLLLETYVVVCIFVGSCTEPTAPKISYLVQPFSVCYPKLVCEIWSQIAYMALKGKVVLVLKHYAWRRMGSGEWV